MTNYRDAAMTESNEISHTDIVMLLTKIKIVSNIEAYFEYKKVMFGEYLVRCVFRTDVPNLKYKQIYFTGAAKVYQWLLDNQHRLVKVWLIQDAGR